MATETNGSKELTRQMTVDQVIQALRYCDDEAPVAALRAAVEYGAEIVPALMQEIMNAAEDSANGVLTLHDSHRLAVMLLTVINARDTLPEILDAFRDDDFADLPLFGEMVTETFPHVVAQLADNAESVIAEMEDPGCESIYHQALIEGLFGVVAEGKASRDEAARLLLQRVAKFTHATDREVMTSMVVALTDLAAPGTEELVMGIFDREPVDRSIIDPSACKKAFAHADEHFERKAEEFRRNRISDPVEYFPRLPKSFVDEFPPQDVDEAIARIREGMQLDDVISAVRWLRRHREESTPKLIQILKEAATFRDDETDEEWLHSDAQDIAAVLLTEFDFADALPVILEGVCHPNPEVVSRFPQLIEGYLDQIVGRLADNPDAIRRLAADPNVNEDVRTELVDGIYWMIIEGKLSRESAIEYLRSWMNQAIEDSDEALTTTIVLALLDLEAKDAEDDIRRAFAQDCIDEYRLCEEEVDEWLQEPDVDFREGLENRRLGRRIENSVIEVRSWLADRDDESGGYHPEDFEEDGDEDGFDERDPLLLPPGLDLESANEYVRGLESFRQMRLSEQTHQDDPDDEYYPPPVETIRTANSKVGRNDPCPCGSGRKYKKCCLKADE
ncbi:MAG: DUF1186 domain-containing protein [Planctomycetaceae bacterium]